MYPNSYHCIARPKAPYGLQLSHEQRHRFICKMILLFLLIVTCVRFGDTRRVSVSLHGGSRNLIQSLSPSLMPPTVEDDLPTDVQIEVIGEDQFDPSVGISTDLSLCFLNRTDILDQDRAIKRIAQSIVGRPLIQNAKESSNTSCEKPVFLIYDGPVGDHSFLNFLVRQALQVHRYRRQRPLSEIYPRPRFLLLPIGGHGFVDNETIESFRKSFLAELRNILSDDNSKAAVNATLASGVPVHFKRQSVDWHRERGIELVTHALQQVKQRFRDYFRDAKVLSNKTAGSEWTKAVEDYLLRLEADFSQLIDSCSMGVRQIGFELLRRQLADDLKPLFREALDHLMQDTLRSFNEEVFENVDVSTGSLTSLVNLRNKFVERFARLCTAANPKSFPTGFGSLARSRQRQLERIFDDYLRERKITMQSQLLLPHRERPPLEVSLHWFVPHPLGLDRRQDVLGSTDVMTFDQSLSLHQLKEKSPVKASTAHGGSVWSSTDPRRFILSSIRDRKLREINEFAREMLMLPLSMRTRWLSKSPDGRSKETTDRDDEVARLLDGLTSFGAPDPMRRPL